jgi:predicted O-methyltransferase YrrM
LSIDRRVIPRKGEALNSILDRILTSATVTDGVETISVRHPEFPDRISHVNRETGSLLQRAVEDVRPLVSLEIGLAYGISTLFICEAIQRLPTPGRHIVIDPYQNQKWRGIGLRNIREAGFESIVDFREEASESVLPRLAAEGLQVDLAFVDGLHRFDQAFVEFFYINRLLRPGGIVLFDDAARRSVNRVIRHALTYPAYEVYGTSASPVAGKSLLGVVRSMAGRLSVARRIIRPEVLQKDWDLGIPGRCVGLRKRCQDQRPTHWDAAM